jgi:tetratricopeptide (TPR) repeat protein
MAKKLNKKVAIIGSLVLAMLIVAAIVAIPRLLGRNPQKYIADAQAALALAEPDYKTAERAYGQAFAYAKDLDLKIDILFKLAKMYLDENEWPKAAGCWNRIINYDTKNIEARHALLDYSYQLAMAGNWTIWKDIESNVSELIEKKLDTSPRMYRIKGKALVELVKRGQITDKETTINNAIEILRKTSEEEPNNVDVYQYLADAIIQNGEILAAKGVLNAAENARQEAEKILLKGVENLPNEPRTYINLYNTKLAEAGVNQGKYKELESKFIDLTKKFSDSSLPYFGLVQLYQRNPKDTGKAVATIQKARELDKQNVSYALIAANLYYRKYSIYKNGDDFQKAMDITTEALTFPDSLDVPGPRARISFLNRYALHTFLANCFAERAAETEGQAEKSKWLESLEKEVYEIKQLLGNVENPYMIMWQGRLLLAQGQTNEAIVQMNTAYEILTVSGEAQTDIQLGRLSYELAKVFQNTPEKGAVVQFYSTAIKNGMHFVKPEIVLDLAKVLTQLQRWSQVIEAVDFFENNFTSNEESTILRIGVYIGSNMFEQAQESLNKLPAEDPNTLRLKIALLNKKMAQTSWQLEQDTSEKEQQLQKGGNREQLKVEQDAMVKERDVLKDKLALLGSTKLTEMEVVDFCKKYILEKQTDKAQKLVGSFLLEHPNSVNIKLYQLTLAEPTPANMPPERLGQLTVKAIESLNDPVRRAFLLGQFYQSKGQNDQAAKYYQQILQLEPGNSLAVADLFDIAVNNQDFKQAETLVETAQQKNIDLCGGEFFKARLAFAKKEYQATIERINNCLEKRPVFSQAYLLRGQARMALEKESDAIDDIRKAYDLNPLDGVIARNLAFLLYNRNQKLGASASVDQLAEAKNAIEVAIRANPKELNLQSFYAEYISDTDPQRAIAICQRIQKVMPSVGNSLLLGKLALKMAEQTTVEVQKNIYLSIAEDGYKKAYELAPQDTRVLMAYSEFYKATGRENEAGKFLAGQDDLLWRFYLRSGKTEEAQRMLEKLYEANSQDVNTIRGLLLASRNKNDQAGILKYTGELAKVDKSVNTQIIQIESYLETGLLDEAQTKLDSLRERYPDRSELMYLQTWLLARQGKTEDALKLANRNLEVDKNNPRVWRLRGQINLTMNNFNQAIDDLQKSKMIQDNAEVRIDLAKAYIRTGKEEEAIAELKVAADEQNSSVSRNMLEEAYLIAGKQDRLEKFYAETIEKFPNDVYWYNRAAEFAMGRGEFDKAFTLFDTALQNSLKINSESPDTQAFDGKLRALLGAKKYDQLLAEATKYLEGPVATIAYARMAGAKAEIGDKDTAVQYFRRALEKAGTNENFLIQILQLMNQTVGFDETVKWCNEKLQTQPDSLTVNLAMFNLYKMTQKYDKAIEYLDNCIRIAADNEEWKLQFQQNKADVLNKLFSITADKTYLKRAIEEYESIVKKEPNNIQILNNLAYLLVDHGLDNEKALQYAQRAYKGLPNNPSVLDTYGYVLLKNGKFKEADEFLQRAIQQFEQNKINAPIEAYEHIGLAKEKLGQVNEALRAYKQAMELAGKDVSQEVKNRISQAIERLSSQ